MKKSMIVMLLALNLAAFAQNSEKQKSYFDKRLKEVKSLVTLNKNQEQKLTSLYQEKCSAQPEDEGEWLFKIALWNVVNDSAKIRSIYQKDLELSVTPARLLSDLTEQKLRYQLTDEQMNSLTALITEKRKDYKLLEYIYPDDSDGKLKASKALWAKYNTKLNMAYCQMGVKNSLMNSASALKYKKELTQSASQVDALVLLALKISKELTANVESSQRLVFEYDKTKEILTKAQYESFMVCKLKEYEVADKLKVKQDLAALKISKQLTDEQVNLLEPILIEKKQAFRKMDLTYPDKLSEDRVKAEKKLNEIYGRKIDFTYVKMGVNCYLTGRVSALKYIKELTLKPVQIDSLCSLAWKLKEFTDTLVTSNRLIIEQTETKKILTKVQSEILLACKIKENETADNLKVKTDLATLKAHKQLTDVQVNSIEPLLIEKKKAYRKLEMSYPDKNGEDWMKAEKVLSDLYSKKLEFAFVKMGAVSYLTGRVYALKYKKELALKPEQIDSLCSFAWKLKENTDTLVSVDRSIIEQTETKKTLTKMQYETLLGYKIKENETADILKVKLDLADLKIHKQLTDAQVKEIEPLLIEKKKAYRKLELSYPDKKSEVRMKAEKALSDLYSKKLEFAYVKMNVNSYLTGRASALKYKKELTLKPQQIDSLCSFAWSLKEIPDTLNPKNRSVLEHNKTKKILSNNQYDNFLKLRVKGRVQKEVLATWKEMKKYNMSAELDSATTCATVGSFYTERDLINERYDNTENGEDEKLIKNQNLNELRPSVLKKLSAVKKREEKKTALQPNALTW